MSIISPKRNLLADSSLWLLLFSNFITIFFATKEGWNLSTIMWVYWFQSITIGFFNFVRILQLKEFSTEGLRINGQSVEPTQSTKIRTAFFFLVHYGLFHFGYMAFLLSGNFAISYGQNFGILELKSIFLTAIIFFVNHLFSYFYNKPKDSRNQNIGNLMFYPYLRIIPMHLTIILGSYYVNALPIFLVLKTFSDAAMHIVEHWVIRKGEEQEI